MKKLIAGLITALLSIFIAAVSLVAQSADSLSSSTTTSTAIHTGAGMDYNYTWVGIVGAIVIILIGIALIRRNRRNNDTGMRKGPERDGGISNPAGGI